MALCKTSGLGVSIDLKNGTALSSPGDNSVVVGAAAANSLAPGLWKFSDILSYVRGKILASNTKGNIPVGDGTRLAALAAGADGSVLLADSSQTLGLSWKAFAEMLAGSYWQGDSIASAATCDLGSKTSTYLAVTGTATITSLGTALRQYRIVVFSAALTLTHNATSLILPAAANILTAANDVAVFRSDAAGNWRCLSYLRADGKALVGSALGTTREVLTANRTYYVRTDGSDGNNGLTNTSGGAFLTQQKAIDVVAALDLSIYDVTIKCGAGTRTVPVILKKVQGAGTASLEGDTTTPANCTQSVTSGNCFDMATGAEWRLRGFKLVTTTSGIQVNISGPGRSLTIDGNMEFGSTPLYQIVVEYDGNLFLPVSYKISSGAQFHIIAQTGGRVRYTAPTVTLTGTPAFSVAFVSSTLGAIVNASGITFSGAATGKRYNVGTNAILNVWGAGATFFPGNVAGTTATGGQYA